MAGGGSWASSSSRGPQRRSRTPASVLRSLPVIDCPHHPGCKLQLLTARTPANWNRRFYRCMKDAMLPTACNFFIWEDKYLAYLIDNGFLEDVDLGPGGSSEMLMAMFESNEKIRLLQCDVDELRQEISELKTGGARIGNNAGSNEKLAMLICVNVVFALLVLALAVMLK
ncbi:hypothetical protein EJB05_33324, partial [Eragrostis curvula]